LTTFILRGERNTDYFVVWSTGRDDALYAGTYTDLQTNWQADTERLDRTITHGSSEWTAYLGYNYEWLLCRGMFLARSRLNRYGELRCRLKAPAAAAALLTAPAWSDLEPTG